ncbi:DUF1178 family protein [Azonexus sp.]|uniref:DUF1178 family protein n=1 Tax=Azonexus sp. TaxID=1872668 RepID=UPI0035B40056
MIIYDLSCDNAHRFEGWFRSAEDFEAQLAQHIVRCPQCDSDDVRRVPSAVAIGGAHAEPAAVPVSSNARAGTATALMPAGEQIAAAYRQLIRAIMENSEDVGNAFADEARKIHYNEAPERSIRGQATPDECEALRDEGIEIMNLPALGDEDLQ